NSPEVAKCTAALGFAHRLPRGGFLSADGKWRLSVEPDQIDPLYRRMLLAAEERSAAASRVLAATP
ncbi:MAG TPA: hypothetical protein VE258_08925, partial [Ktedonobacterales bacterium]|nr:hypothetical protein [Ktedonobacterales bacterium]